LKRLTLDPITPYKLTLQCLDPMPLHFRAAFTTHLENTPNIILSSLNLAVLFRTQTPFDDAAHGLSIVMHILHHLSVISSPKAGLRLVHTYINNLTKTWMHTD
jgi:hypothetical protein